MSLSYRMQVAVEEFSHGRKEALIEAIRQEWDPDSLPPEEYGPSGDEILLSGTNALYGGEGAGGFAARAARAIWRANGGYCSICVDAQPDDGEPCDTIELSRDDYDMLKDEGGSPAATEACPDCGALPGENHRDGCDVESCPSCGHQLISCSCADESPDGRFPWSGTWPGVEECLEYGWYARLGPDGWVPCTPHEPGAEPDLNRLRTEARWDPVRRMFLRE